MDRQEVFQYVKQQYGTAPEYPWMDANVVLRHTDNQKWYGLVMQVGRDKLGLDGDAPMDVLNVKCDPIMVGSLRMQPGFRPAYHMSKDKWISILLDGSAPENEIKSLLAMSYRLTAAKPHPAKKSANEKIYNMRVSKIYPLLLAKAERKGRTRNEADKIISWLTGYTARQIAEASGGDMTYADFFKAAPAMNPNREQITGTVCGVRIEEIAEPLMRDIRCLDKLIDELAKGKTVEKILRQRG